MRKLPYCLITLLPYFFGLSGSPGRFALPPSDQTNAPCEVGRANRLGEPLIRVVRAIRMLKMFLLSFIPAPLAAGLAKTSLSFLILFSLCGSLYGAEPQPAPEATKGAASTWAGVDETVIEKYAEEAGRSARKPLINTDQGDLLLFVFLVAGAIGGFVAGYSYRSLVQRSNTLLAALLLAGLAGIAPSSAQEHHVEPQSPHQHIHEPSDAPLSYEIILSLYSMDIWNGMVGYDHPMSHIAPRIAYAQETLGTFALGADLLYPIGSPRPATCGGLSEIDVVLAWDRSFGPINLELGATYYSLMPDHRDDLYEGFAGIRYENDIVTPYVIGYYDFNQTDGTYFKGGLCRTFKLMERLSADIDLCCGYGLPQYNRGYFDMDRAAFTDATLQLLLQYDITDYLFIGGTAAFSMLLDNSIRDSRDVNEAYDTIDNFWFGLHTGIHF